MPKFMFTATVAEFLRQHTYMSELSIACALDHYGHRGCYETSWTIKSTKPGNHHYKLWPVPGGWHVREWRMWPLDSTYNAVVG